jgi:hypothetical protein
MSKTYLKSDHFNGGGSWEWQCRNVNVRVTLSENQAHWPISTEYVVSGIEKSNNRFKYVWGRDELYLNDKLCALKTKPLPKEQEETKPQASPEPVKQTKPKTVLYNEPGGVISDHWKRWQALALSGEKLLDLLPDVRCSIEGERARKSFVVIH